jgi:hypothetical protein
MGALTILAGYRGIGKLRKNFLWLDRVARGRGDVSLPPLCHAQKVINLF